MYFILFKGFYLHVTQIEHQDGNGRIVFANEDSYEGTFKRNQFHGPGVFTSHNGDVYTGQFQNGLQCGRGKMEFWNKCTYDGEWKDSKMHGTGKFTGTSRFCM